MFGFGKKKKKEKKVTQDLGVQLHTIPDVFYGGNDPVIYHNQATKQSGAKKYKEQKRKPMKLVSKKQGTSHRKLVFSQHKKLFLWGGGIFAVLLVTGAATWYYVSQARQQILQQTLSTKTPTTTVQVEIQQPTTVSGPVATSTPTSTSTLDATTTADIANIQAVEPVSFPRILLINSEDTDSDQLTDEEEAVFKTNQDVWDTDNDGYYDGQEIVNLYNPGGFAPVRLIDSGLIKEYVSPQWKYRVYYPATWQIGTVDARGRQVLASTLSGDFVEIRVFDRVQTQSFQDWFSVNIEGEQFQDLQTMINRFDLQGFLRRDGLVAYFPADNTVTVLIYHPGITGVIPYRHVMRMMVESFRTTASGSTLPEQATLPTPPGQQINATTTSPQSATSTTSTTE